ncbi:uncharacterized protein EDB91DRAFT_1336796 [Suillus paluster]|uniref:uncharacterized protein n=1 Tax=Suillus paluster TaxID=48578 RepID=UPI001B861974|nr:uncharacterized protein EDB91DRAFT_1336796 [Suillus paluster]KAG1739467.1 hypothetical protein EDB91DRAFT_1336796 [Suillus paluster]
MIHVLPVHKHVDGHILGGLVLTSFRLLLNLFVQTYDYACSLHEEWTFLLGSRWTKVKVLYIVTRFMPFFLITTNLYTNFTPTENLSKCQTLINLDLSFGIISVTCSESFFVLRTYALWNNDRYVLAIMLTGFLAVLVASIITSFSANATTPYPTSTIPNITGCSSSADLFIPFIILFAFELGLLSLTLIRAIQSWRSANGPIYAILVKHNIFYYACGLFFSTLNVLTLLLLDYQYHAMFRDFQFIILAILALRMHLQLWQINGHAHGPDTLMSDFMCIPLTDISSAVVKFQLRGGSEDELGQIRESVYTSFRRNVLP